MKTKARYTDTVSDIGKIDVLLFVLQNNTTMYFKKGHNFSHTIFFIQKDRDATRARAVGSEGIK